MSYLKLKTLWLFSIGLILVIFLTATGIQANTTVLKLYVSPDGNDVWSGQLAEANKKQDGPFQTLERARDQIRALKKAGKLNKNGVIVYLRHGVYERQSSFILTTEDSGTKQAPIVYQAYSNEKVKILGGKEVNGFHPITNAAILKRIQPAVRNKILELDLKSQGINDYGQLSLRGFNYPEKTAPMELFFADQRMQLARWPNLDYLKIADVPAGADAGKFTYDGDRPKQWQDISDIWLHGYWTWDWADSYTKIKQINTQTREIFTESPHGIYGYKKGGRYYVLNALEELDSPGEYYIDRKTGTLYFYPPSSIENKQAIVSILSEPIISLKDASYIILKNLVLENARGSGIKISGGENILVTDSIIRNLGTNGIEINGGMGHGVINDELYNIGETGIILEGGDRNTLTPAKHYAADNHIHDFAQWVKTYRPGILITGVGNSISHNLIHHAPHNAILLGGNDHIIEFNNIHRVCLETADAGAFYMGRNYAFQGNIVRYNYFHNLYSIRPESAGEVIAVYLDDAASGTTVLGNIFADTQMGILIGGGRDNKVKSNIFIKSKVSVFIDARVLGWAKDQAARGGLWQIVELLEAINYKRPPYSTRYPKLVNILEEYGVPKGNEITDNLIFGDKGWLRLFDNLTDKTIKVTGNILEKDTSFVAPNNDPLRLEPNTPTYKLGFNRVPLRKIRQSL
jgi:parallel beta-helix repeat protein